MTIQTMLEKTMKNTATEKTCAPGVAAPLNKDEFTKATYAHLKSIKDRLSTPEVEALTAEKTASYAKAVASTDEAVAALQSIAAELPSEARAELDAAVVAVTDFVMFNGEASMTQNSQWDNGGGEYTG